MNKARQKKLMWVGAVLIGAIVAVLLIVYAIGQQTDYYYDPTAIAQNKAPQNKRIRAGGMVVAGSVHRDSVDPLMVHFDITDQQSIAKVSYRGVLPDLFAENSGVVATGQLQDGVFVASEVLAKHDENYMPPEVAKSLKQQHGSTMPATSMKEIDERNNINHTQVMDNDGAYNHNAYDDSPHSDSVHNLAHGATDDTAQNTATIIEPDALTHAE